MNYPIWDVPASGLFIAGMAILHVFISHFAVGGGIFLVWLEGKALRESDQGLLQYVQGHSRFFLLLTLVLGAVTGVGIWFTIGLVHPQATSTLIQTFVWVWALEWVFFLIEIMAAMVYYYGWNRLSPRRHQLVGWIYFAAAWMSLIIINGILTFMLTPGDWPQTRDLLDGFFNPTYWPGLLLRSLVAMGLAGLYAFLTAARLKDQDLHRRLIRYTTLRWVLPSLTLLPFGVAWFLTAAAGAGIPVAEVLGAEDGGWRALGSALFVGGAASGYPIAQTAGFILALSTGFLLVGTLVWGLLRPEKLTTVVAVFFLLGGLAAFGSGEFIREDLRKPYVLGKIMFLNGLRLPPGQSLQAAHPAYATPDPFSVKAVGDRGVLRSAQWLPEEVKEAGKVTQVERGRQVFRLLCSSCHTLGGYLAIRPLVAGKSTAALENVIGRLAVPVDAAGNPTSWQQTDFRLRTWRGRRMPPFVGTSEEKQALALYLASLSATLPAGTAAGSDALSLGQQQFETKCIFCHGREAGWPMTRLAPGRPAAGFYERIGRLPTINPIMPPFEGTDEERQALADYLAHLVAGGAAAEEVNR